MELEPRGELAAWPEAADEPVAFDRTKRHIRLPSAPQEEPPPSNLELPTGVEVLAEPHTRILGERGGRRTPDR